MPAMRRVLLICDGYNVATQMLAQLLRAARKYGYSHGATFLDTVPEDLGTWDVPIFVDCVRPFDLVLMEYFIASGIPYLYYLDNNYWRLRDYRHNIVLIRTLDALIANARCVMVNSEVLAEEVKRHDGAAVTLPAFYDFAMLDGLEREPHAGEIRIGYPSGRWRDIRPLIPVFERLSQRYEGKLYFELFGTLPDGLRSREWVRCFDMIPDYVEFSAFQFSRGWDIGIAPLLPTPANFSKTNNKYREYGACSIAGVYSDVPPYSDSVRHRHTGLLVSQSVDDWYDALVELIDNPGLRRTYGRNAHEDVRALYSLDLALPSWIRILDDIPCRKTAPARPVRIPSGAILKFRIGNLLYDLFSVRSYLNYFGVKETIRKLARIMISLTTGKSGSPKPRRW